ncbi:MAG: hypothetical protein K8J08_16700 [Thermoanaerobaculia bacterium]|nr:hypothetical protein [Thermoanaerobaculia bacterium]
MSPVSASEVAMVEAQCPSFSWTTTENGGSYELVVYRINPDSLEQALDEKPVLWVTVPGAANSWTPTLESCLSPGQRYVWSIRSGGDEKAPWSEPSVFEIASRATDSGFERAVEILRRELGVQSADQRVGSAPAETNERSPAVSSRPGPAAQPATQGGASFDVDGSGNVVANSFSGSGAGLSGVAADTATTASALAADPSRCNAGDAMNGILANGSPSGCLDVVSGAEFQTHKTSADHDARYAPLTGQQVTGNLNIRATPGSTLSGVLIDGASNLNFAPAMTVKGVIEVEGAVVNAISVDGVVLSKCRYDSQGRRWDEVGIWCVDPTVRSAETGPNAIEICHNKQAVLCPLEAIMTCDQANVGSSSLNSCGTVTDSAGAMVIRTFGHDGDGSGSAFNELLSYDGSDNSVAPVNNATTLPFFCCALSAGL